MVIICPMPLAIGICGELKRAGRPLINHSIIPSPHGLQRRSGFSPTPREAADRQACRTAGCLTDPPPFPKETSDQTKRPRCFERTPPCLPQRAESGRDGSPSRPRCRISRLVRLNLNPSATTRANRALVSAASRGPQQAPQNDRSRSPPRARVRHRPSLAALIALQ